MTLDHAFEALERNRTASDHNFWPHENSVLDLLPEIRARLVGHKQIADAILLDLAIRKGGRLVTLDQRVRHLLAEDSPHQSVIEVIATV